jgi:hypothetical protein
VGRRTQEPAQESLGDLETIELINLENAARLQELSVQDSLEDPARYARHGAAK